MRFRLPLLAAVLAYLIAWCVLTQVILALTGEDEFSSAICVQIVSLGAGFLLFPAIARGGREWQQRRAEPARSVLAEDKRPPWEPLLSRRLGSVLKEKEIPSESYIRYALKNKLPYARLKDGSGAWSWIQNRSTRSRKPSRGVRWIALTLFAAMVALVAGAMYSLVLAVNPLPILNILPMFVLTAVVGLAIGLTGRYAGLPGGYAYEECDGSPGEKKPPGWHLYHWRLRCRDRGRSHLYSDIVAHDRCASMIGGGGNSDHGR